jgi:hypothetical protein
MSFKDSAGMSSGRIIKIYNALFDRMTPLFVGVMVETKPDDLNETESDIFDNITAAVMHMLSQMAYHEICIVLRHYSSDAMIVRYRHGARIVLGNSGYLNIDQAVETLRSQGFYLP